MDGLIILDKPVGITSARAVEKVKWLLPRRVRVGHAGALDPFATGVLILLIGRATRQCERIMGWRKTYHATARLGATTATDDADSPEQPHAVRDVEVSEIVDILQTFVGTIEQRPSRYSAVKISGRRACDLAREGREVALPPRPVQIHRIQLLEYHWPALGFEVECGRGTYIRALARDIGERLGVGAYLTALRRSRIGPFGLEHAVRPDALNAQNLPQHLLPLAALPAEA
jgi:tRNA pseudouridine55 synthase